jgi:hypothetical protein
MKMHNLDSFYINLLVKLIKFITSFIGYLSNTYLIPEVTSFST